MILFVSFMSKMQFYTCNNEEELLLIRYNFSNYLFVSALLYLYLRLRNFMGSFKKLNNQLLSNKSEHKPTFT